MIDLGKIDEIVTRLTESLPPGAAQMREEAEARFRAVLKRAFEKMDLVTREEFEAQKTALAKANQRLEALQQRIEGLGKQES